MRRIAFCLTLALAVAPLGGAVAGGSDRDLGQALKGRIEHGHQVFGLGVDEGGCLFLAQRLLLAASPSTNGVTGFGFRVDPETFGQPFALTPLGDEVPGDLDIAFYRGKPGSSDAFNTAGRRTFATRAHQGGQQGEYGRVPAGFRHALVCYAEAEGRGVDFRYESGPGARVPRGHRI